MYNIDNRTGDNQIKLDWIIDTQNRRYDELRKPHRRRTKYLVNLFA